MGQGEDGGRGQEIVYSAAAGLVFLAFAALFGSLVHVLSEVWGRG